MFDDGRVAMLALVDSGGSDGLTVEAIWLERWGGDLVYRDFGSGITDMY